MPPLEIALADRHSDRSTAWCIAAAIIGIASVLARAWNDPEAGRVLVLMPLHVVSMAICGLAVGSALRRCDYLRPSVVARLTFALLYVLSLPVVALDTEALATVGIQHVMNWPSIERAVAAQLTVATGFVCLLAGEWLARLLPPATIFREPHARSWLFAIVAMPMVFLGMTSNATICGGWPEYLAKMGSFYVRSTEWEQFSDEGGFIVSQMIRWLPISLLVLAWGVVQMGGLGTVASTVCLAAGSLANLFLSSATGGRGIGLTTLFYSIVVFNSGVRRLRLRDLLVVVALLASGAFFQGVARGIARTEGTLAVEQFEDRINETKLRTFWLSYLTNDLRLLQVMAAVEARGTAGGATLVDPLWSLAEGRPAITTGTDLQRHEPEDYRSTAARFGILSDGYYNFGITGAMAAMVVAGLIVGLLDRAYLSARARDSVSGAIIVAWSAFSANFVVAANFHSLPKYFLLASAPIYLYAVILRGRRC
jgi:hypothetical protein